MEDKKEQLNNEIISQIKEGKVEMKPRWFFLLRAIFGILGTFLISLCLVFLVSFIMFGLRKSGIIFAPEFGARGFFLFISSLPWILITFSAAFLLVLQILIKRYSFVYRKPIIYSLVALVVITALICLILPSFTFHNAIFKSFRPENGAELPPVGKFYRNFGVPHPPEVIRGFIVDFSTGTLIIATDDGATSSVIINDFTRMSPDVVLESGRELLILGPRSTSGIIRAFGIREISD